jgi:hypothetical protein
MTKHLLVALGDTIHTEVKIRATAKGMSMRMWILQAVLEKIRAEKEYE